MIINFAHKGLEKFFVNGTRKGIRVEHSQRLGDILDRLDASANLEDMRYPGSGLHKLKGNRKGYYSVKVSGNWRVIFRFEHGDAYVVDYLDYH